MSQAKVLIDLTGGFGVDDFYFAKKMKKVTHCEINPELSLIVKHNFEQLQVQNINCHSGDSLEILAQLHTQNTIGFTSILPEEMMLKAKSLC